VCVCLHVGLCLCASVCECVFVHMRKCVHACEQHTHCSLSPPPSPAHCVRSCLHMPSCLQPMRTPSVWAATPVPGALAPQLLQALPGVLEQALLADQLLRGARQLGGAAFCAPASHASASRSLDEPMAWRRAHRLLGCTPACPPPPRLHISPVRATPGCRGMNGTPSVPKPWKPRQHGHPFFTKSPRGPPCPALEKRFGMLRAERWTPNVDTYIHEGAAAPACPAQPCPHLPRPHWGTMRPPVTSRLPAVCSSCCVSAIRERRRLSVMASALSAACAPPPPPAAARCSAGSAAPDSSSLRCRSVRVWCCGGEEQQKTRRWIRAMFAPCISMRASW